MAFFRKLKIKTRLFLAFAVIMFLTAFSNTLSHFGLLMIDSNYTLVLKLSSDSINAISNVVSYAKQINQIGEDLIYFIYNSTKVQDCIKTINDFYKQADDSYNLLKNIQINNNSNSEEVQRLESYKNVINEFKSSMNTLIEYVNNKNVNKANNQWQTSTKPATDNLSSVLGGLMTNANDSISKASVELSNASSFITILIDVISVFTLLLAILYALLLTKNINKSINDLIDKTILFANGDLNLNLRSNNHDEFSILSNNLAVVVDNIQELTNEINTMQTMLNVQGDVEARMDVSKFRGAYYEMAVAINDAVGSLVEDSKEAIMCMAAYAGGDLSLNIKQHVGKKAIMNHAMDKLRNNLQSFIKEVQIMAEAAQKGDLTKRMNPDAYENQWAKLAMSLNALLESVIEPITEAIAVFETMSKGKLDTEIKGNYKGDFANMKAAANKSVGFIKDYLFEISDILTKMSKDNFDIEIKNEYIGDFVSIKAGLEGIINSINTTFAEISESTEIIADGSKQISQSSILLAQGASEQAQEVERLVNAITDISEQTRQNSDNANTANKLALETKENATIGNSEMHDMYLAMSEIDKASSDISNIIKVIDEIAFQTNLLALNAAVEAARAGQYGKGFAVVAEEVRSLAARSQHAAKETTVLIEGTVQKVAQGTVLANKTAATLQTIVEQINNISDLVGDVAEASARQETSIEMVNQGIMQIANVTQSNTATSEEEAASSERLSGQAEKFRNTIARFKLKNGKNIKRLSVQPSNNITKLPELKKETPIAASAKPIAAKPIITKPSAVTTTNSNALPVTMQKPVQTKQPTANKSLLTADKKVAKAKSDLPESPEALLMNYDPNLQLADIDLDIKNTETKPAAQPPAKQASKQLPISPDVTLQEGKPPTVTSPSKKDKTEAAKYQAIYESKDLGKY